MAHRKPHRRYSIGSIQTGRVAMRRVCGLSASSLAVGALIFVSGCDSGDEISSYTVPKPHVLFETNHVDSDRPAGAEPRSPDDRDRMIAAIVPQGGQTWFLKVTGPDEAVQDQMESFLAFVQSIELEAAGPKWTLPAGWQQEPGSGMRFATLQLPSAAGPLELSVIGLPSGGDTDEYALSNINRWRGQLGLGPTTSDQLFAEGNRGEETLKVKTNDGTTAILVNLVGQMKDTGMGNAPFASGQGRSPRPTAPRAAAPRSSANSPAGSATVKNPVSYDAPEGWVTGPASGMRKAAFLVRDGEQQAEITIIDLAAAAGDLLPNVNRWRGQVQLGPTTGAQLQQELKPIAMGSVAGQYVELVGPESAAKPQTILAVIAVHDDKAWFIKLMGDAALAEREKERFQSFVESIRFQGAEGVDNGK